MVGNNLDPGLPKVRGQDIVAWHSPDTGELREEFTRPWRIVGAIMSTSPAFIDTDGFRCWSAEPVALARSPLWGDDERRAAERAAQRYEVPLVHFDRLAAVASEHGSPAPAEARPQPIESPEEPASDLLEAAPPDESPPLEMAHAHPEDTPSPTIPGHVPPEEASRTSSEGTTTTRPPTSHIARSELSWVKPFKEPTWVGWCALAGAVAGLVVAVWLFAQADTNFAGLPPFLALLSAAAVAAGSVGRHIPVGISAAAAGAVNALVALGVTPNEPELAWGLFVVLLVAWLMVAIAFVCALVGAASLPRDAPALEKVAAVASFALPLAVAIAVGLLGLSAALGALVIAGVEIASLFLWHTASEHAARPASG